MCHVPYHPDDPDGNWDYDSAPDPDEYWEKYGDFDQYDKDYDAWENEQRS